MEELLQKVEGLTGEIGRLGLMTGILSDDLHDATTQGNLDDLTKKTGTLLNRGSQVLQVLKQVQSLLNARVIELIASARTCKDKGLFVEAWLCVSAALEANSNNRDVLQVKQEIMRDLEMVDWGLLAAAQKLLAEGKFEEAFKAVDQQVPLPNPDPELERSVEELKKALQQRQIRPATEPPQPAQPTNPQVEALLEKGWEALGKNHWEEAKSCSHCFTHPMCEADFLTFSLLFSIMRLCTV